MLYTVFALCFQMQPNIYIYIYIYMHSLCYKSCHSYMHITSEDITEKEVKKINSQRSHAEI
jgi:hypothetical protein